MFQVPRIKVNAADRSIPFSKATAPLKDIARGLSTGTKPTGFNAEATGCACRLKIRPRPPTSDLKMADDKIVALVVDVGSDNGIRTIVFAVFTIMYVMMSDNIGRAAISRNMSMSNSLFKIRHLSGTQRGKVLSSSSYVIC